MNETAQMLGEALKSPFVLLPLLASPLFALAVLLIWRVLNRHDVEALSQAVTTAIGQSQWVLVHSGRRSRHFLDADRFLGLPENLERFAAWFRDHVEETQKMVGKIHCLAFIEKREGPVGLVTSKDLLSTRTKLPSIVVRPRRRLLQAALKGSHTRSPNVLRPGDNVIIVSDVITTGATFLRAIDILEHFGANVVEAIALYDRKDEHFDRVGFDRRNIRVTTMLQSSDVENWLGQHPETDTN